MKPEIKTKWLQALRSGDYKQGTEYLRYKEGEENNYCCLGVLCDIFHKETGQGEWKPSGLNFRILRFDGSEGILPLIVRDWANLEKSDPLLTKTECASCLNDDRGKTFLEIADLIEKNL